MMVKLDRALIQALVQNATIALIAKYSATRLSICMANPKQAVLKPSILVESDQRPLTGTDSSRLKNASISLYACGNSQLECKQILDCIYDLFFDSEKKEKKFDISNEEVYCMGSYWESVQNPSFDSQLDCFIGVILITVKWSER